MLEKGKSLPAKTFVPVRGIYCIENMENGRVYVGQSVNVLDRWTTHFSDLHQGTHPNRDLQREWSLYGPESFRVYILEVVGDDQPLKRAEDDWCLHFINRDVSVYNVHTERLAGGHYCACETIKGIGLELPPVFEDCKWCADD